MELVEVINKRLIDHFSKNDQGEAFWRVVWSEEQFEVRFGDYEDRTPEGFLIRRVSGHRRVPKYRQWIKERYVLERLLVVPAASMTELVTQMSYEPLHVFEDRHGNPLPPIWDAIKFIIDTVNNNMGQKGMRHKDPESNPESAMEQQEIRVKELEDHLFGNESYVGDALMYKEGVVVPSNYKSDNIVKEV